MTASAGPVLKQLHAKFGGRIDFLTVYVREAHPGDRYPQPHDLARKMQHAKEYRDRDRIPWPVAVDDEHGTLHRALDGKPNAAYLITANGVIAQRVLWSNDAHGVRDAIEAVLAGRPFAQRESKMLAMMRGVGCMAPTLASAGLTALRDLRREAPPVYALARVAGAFTPLPPLGRTAAAMAVLLGSMAAIGLAVRAVTRAPRRA
jgi:hypothetical protein